MTRMTSDRLVNIGYNLALRLVMRWEGLGLRPYHDSAGHCTIGWGHLCHKGPVTAVDVEFYDGFTEADARLLLVQDLERFYRAAYLAFPVPTAGPVAACTSLAFNIGVDAFRASSAHRLISLRQPDAAVCASIARWRNVTIEGQLQRSPGLVNRRADEVAMFLGTHEFQQG